MVPFGLTIADFAGAALKQRQLALRPSEPHMLRPWSGFAMAERQSAYRSIRIPDLAKRFR